MGQLAEYFRGKLVILTGGSSGIGRALAGRLTALGAELTLIARRRALLEQAATELGELTPPAPVHTLDLDVASSSDVEGVVRWACDRAQAKAAAQGDGQVA
jgi:3-dehydrosphinganine reductase